MSPKEQLHQLLDELPENRLPAAREFLEQLKSSDVDDEPLTEDDLKAVRRGSEDVRSGRVKSLDQYERERGL